MDLLVAAGMLALVCIVALLIWSVATPAKTADIDKEEEAHVVSEHADPKEVLAPHSKTREEKAAEMAYYEQD